MAFPTTGILDNFNRANESPLSNGTWGSVSSANDLVLDTNQVRGAATNSLSARTWTPEEFGPDCECYVTVKVLPGGSNYIRFMLRSTSISSIDNSYFMQWTNDSNGCRIFVNVSGTGTVIAQAASARYAVDDVIGFECVGSQITAYKNGTAVTTASDTTYPDAGYFILGMRQGTVRVDDCGGGTSVPAAAPAFVPRAIIF